MCGCIKNRTTNNLREVLLNTQDHMEPVNDDELRRGAGNVTEAAGSAISDAKQGEGVIAVDNPHTVASTRSKAQRRLNAERCGIVTIGLGFTVAAITFAAISVFGGLHGDQTSELILDGIVGGIGLGVASSACCYRR